MLFPALSVLYPGLWVPVWITKEDPPPSRAKPRLPTGKSGLPTRSGEEQSFTSAQY